MTIRYYQPWALLNGLSREMDRALQKQQQEQANPVNSWQPAVDIREEIDSFILSMDVPGVDPKAIQVSMEKGVLEISGERKTAQEDTENRSFHHEERIQGAFKRRFKLPESADDTEISARSEHGVLEIVIKKRAEQQPRRISITH